jgi:hypothetical protein
MISRLLKLTVLYGLMMAAAGCAAVRERPPVDPQLVRGNILRLANAEWNAFGNQTIYRDGGRERIDPVGVWEDERRGSPRIAQYWKIVDEDWTGYDCDKPWSAAFISWLMLESGVAAKDFTLSGLHADYLRDIARQQSAANARFALRPVGDYTPRPGDLICATRAGSHIDDINAIPDGTPMHCDLVTLNENGRMESVGGNVRNSVSKTVRQVDAQGRLPLDGDRPWMLVVQNKYP